MVGYHSGDFVKVSRSIRCTAVCGWKVLMLDTSHEPEPP